VAVKDSGQHERLIQQGLNALLISLDANDTIS